MTKFIVVHGAPCSGKSTYVRGKITSSDMVYDYDEITRALTYSSSHLSKRELTHGYVLDIRLAIIRRAREEKSLDNIYLLSTFLTESFKKFISDLNPEYVEMQATREECLERLQNDDARPDKEDWAKKINDWYDEYEIEQDRNNKLKHLIGTFIKS